MDQRGRFLAHVGSRLTLPHEVRVDVLEELDTHLSDTIDDLVARGRDPAAAEAEAIERLGPPAELASALSRAHRPPTRLLAAAGAGTWAAIREGALGTAFAWLFLFLALLIGMAAVQAGAQLLGQHANVSWGSGWNTVMLALALHAGVLFAGSAAVRAAAASGWRSAAEVRWPIALLGALALAWFAWVAIAQPQNWASVIALSLVPVSFVIGARFERLSPPRAGVLALGLLVVGVAGFGTATMVHNFSSRGAATAYSWNELTHGYEMIAPWWRPPDSTLPQPFSSGSSSSSTLGEITMSVQATSAAEVAAFHDLRLEAWKAEVPGDGWRLLPGQTAPFASAPAVRQAATVSGSLTFNRTPGVTWAQVVLTGVAPDGTRYLLYASGPEQTEFAGSVLDWFVAISR